MAAAGEGCARAANARGDTMTEALPGCIGRSRSSVFSKCYLMEKFTMSSVTVELQSRETCAVVIVGIVRSKWICRAECISLFDLDPDSLFWVLSSE
eukprot:4109718-Pleurochrysis_carterae.AAC.1